MTKPSRRAPGIYELEPGVFKIVVSLGRSDEGRYQQRARVVRGSLRDAKAARARLLTEADDGTVVGRSSATFGAVLDRWLEHIEGLGRSPTTIAAYRTIVRHHLKPALGARSVSTITTLDLDTLYSKIARVRKPSTVAKIHVVARGALKQAVRWRIIGRNPALDASVPAIRRPEPTGATPEELRRLLDAAEDDFATILLVAATTGMRRGELCGLTWNALELPKAGNGIATIQQVVIHGPDDRALVRPSTKTGRSRRISLDPATVAELRVHRARCRAAVKEWGGVAPDAFVFSPVPGNSQPYQPHTVTQRFARLCARVGIEGLSFHRATRHFAATQLIASGVDVRTVAGRLGHSRASVTLDVYAHLLVENDEGAAELLGSIVTRRG